MNEKGTAMYSSAETVPSELSNYGILNRIHVDLIGKRNRATDPCERERLNTLIANCVGLKVSPDFTPLRKQMVKNAASLEKYLAERK
jgi:hypothetical protein